MGGDRNPRVSVVVPLFNEESNVDALLDELAAVLPALGTFEVLAVDDGSTDATRARLAARLASFRELRVLSCGQNGGQSAALCVGFEHARAPIVLTMDGDLQNDPRDFAMLIDALQQGADLVTGVRVERRDSWLRRASSWVANRVRNVLTGDRVADSGCGIRGMRTELARRLPRFRGMHRFLPTLARLAGGRVVEVPVHHRPRYAGTSKYGIRNRALRGLVDVFGVRWLQRRWIAGDPREHREISRPTETPVAGVRATRVRRRARSGPAA